MTRVVISWQPVDLVVSPRLHEEFVPMYWISLLKKRWSPSPPEWPMSWKPLSLRGPNAFLHPSSTRCFCCCFVHHLQLFTMLSFHFVLQIQSIASLDYLQATSPNSYFTAPRCLSNQVNSASFTLSMWWIWNVETHSVAILITAVLKRGNKMQNG